jgi:hypothetical protein
VPVQIEPLIREASRIEEDALFSGKGHFETASSWSKAHFWIGIPAAVLAALSGISVLKDAPEVAVVLAALVTGLTAVLTFLNPQERANAHHTAGARFNSVRNDARVLREVELVQDQPPADALERLKSLSKARDELNLSSPQIPRRAFERARRSVEAGESSYAVDRKQTL